MLKLIQTDNEQFDLAVDVAALTDALTAFSTLVYAALFTDAEADATQSPERYARRGWWSDPELGSLIWWYRQQPLSAEIRRDVAENIRRVLSSRPELSNVKVSDITAAGNVSSVFLAIAADYNGAPQQLQLNVIN